MMELHSLLTAAIAHHQRIEEETQSHRIVRPREVVTTDPYRDTRSTPGDERYRRIQQTLDSFGYTRSDDQKLFHDHFLQACLPHIYNEEWDTNSLRILQAHKIENIHPEIFVLTPRRWGKTYSVAMFGAAMLLCVNKCDINVYSPGKRASSLLAKTIMKMIHSIPGASERIVKQSEEAICIADTPRPAGLGINSAWARQKCADPNSSWLYSFPGGVDRLRGTGCKIAILEEAAYVHNDVMLKVLGPLMGINNFVILAISTPSDEDNYYSNLLELKKPSGEPLFKQLRVGLACDTCTNEGKSSECKHRLHRLPQWKDPARQERMRMMYGSDEATFARENMGLIASDRTFILSRAEVARLREKPRIQDLSFKPQVLYLAIDPSGGGKSSDFAIVSTAVYGEKQVVSYMRK